MEGRINEKKWCRLPDSLCPFFNFQFGEESKEREQGNNHLKVYEKSKHKLSKWACIQYADVGSLRVATGGEELSFVG